MECHKLVVKGRIMGTIEWRNVFYLETASQPANSELLTDMPAWMTGFYTPILEDMVTVCNIYGFDVHSWDRVARKWQWKLSGNKSIVGTASSDPSPTQVAIVMVAYTALSRVFARKFIPGSNDITFNGSTLIGATLARMTTSLAFWMSDFTAPSLKIYTPGTWTKGNLFQVFVQGVVDSVAGTMRRRKAGVGI